MKTNQICVALFGAILTQLLNTVNCVLENEGELIFAQVVRCCCFKLFLAYVIIHFLFFSYTDMEIGHLLIHIQMIHGVRENIGVQGLDN